MRYDKNFAYFIGQYDWYTVKKGVGYVPTDKAPIEAIEAMMKYNAYTFGTHTLNNNDANSMQMFTYNISKNADEQAFAYTCSLIEANIDSISKEKLLIDVDGSKIQIYETAQGKIKVFNDFEIDAVYVNSDINLEWLWCK